MSDISKWISEKFDAQVAPDGSNVSENFKKWFASSKVLNEAGHPAVVHHGTGNVESIMTEGFKYDFAGKGNCQLGPGWYFTNSEHTAKGYEERLLNNQKKLGGDTSPGTIDVYLSLKNPLVVQWDQNLWHSFPEITYAQALALIKNAPDIDDLDGAISNHFDAREKGFEKNFREMVNKYTGQQGHALTIFNDFYNEDANHFLPMLKKVTGFDGVICHFESGEVHYVAWDPSDIKSAKYNNGLFSQKSSLLTDADVLIDAKSDLKALIDGFINESKQKIAPKP